MERGGNSISTASGEDRISNLPESLIHHILSFFSDTTYAVQTCVLSKRWRYIWTSLPVLKFSDDYHYRDSDDEEDDVYIDREDMCFVNRFIGFVDKVLSLRANNSDIQMFHFEYSIYYLPDDKSDRFINRCIAAAASHNVQELCIRMKPPNDSEILHLISTCRSLTKLELEFSGYDYDDDDEFRSKIFIPSEISFPRLKSLCMSLEFFSFYDEESTNNFFSSFPNLESLVIVFLGLGSGFPDMNLTISLPKLKYFNFTFEGQDLEINSKVTLYAPSLSSFICNSEMVTSFIVENLPSLVTAEIQICVAAGSRQKQFYAQRTMGLLRGIRSVKALTLNFSILKNLELETDQTCFLKDCLGWVFYILKSSPNIESVSLRLSQHPDEPPLHEYHEEVKFNPKNIGGDYWDVELSSSCMICHLKYVAINGICGCADELKFLEILLKHATVLEKVVLASDSPEQDSQQKKGMAEFSEMLLKLPTASKNILILLTS